MTSHQQTRIISIYSEIRSVTDSTLTLSSATATVTDLSLGRTALQNKEMGTDMCAASGGRPMNTSLGLEFPAQPGRRFQPLPQTTIISGITALEMGSQNHDVDWLGRGCRQHVVFEGRAIRSGLRVPPPLPPWPCSTSLWCVAGVVQW